MTADVSLGWKPDDQRFGARLALVRQYMGWGNVKEAALACRQPPESWRTWERDNVRPRDIVRISREISAATGCDYYWLLDGSTGPGNSERHPEGCRCVLCARRDSNPQPSDP
jgi:hypothetical protein